MLTIAMTNDLFSQAIGGLVAAGPVATVLGVVCYALWKQNQSLLDEMRQDKKRMINLAMRVTKAVETLAGIEPGPDEDPADDGH